MSDPETIRVYDERADEYADMMNAHDPHLSAFLASLPERAHVLDLGCGPGISSAAIAAAGHIVDAVDASSEMVERANRYPGVSARQALFHDIAGSGIHDGVWANFSLLHAPRDQFAGHLAAVHQTLKPGGLFHIGMKLGTGEGPDRLGRFYTYYTQQELEQFVQDAGFTITDRNFGSGPGLEGSVSDWIVLLAHA